MASIPRSRQTPVSIRSDKAAALLRRLTRRGRSQAEVIEEALERVAENDQATSVSDLNAAIDAIVKPWHGIPGKSREEIEADMYDEDGLPR